MELVVPAHAKTVRWSFWLHPHYGKHSQKHTEALAVLLARNPGLHPSVPSHTPPPHNATAALLLLPVIIVTAVLVFKLGRQHHACDADDDPPCCCWNDAPHTSVLLHPLPPSVTALSEQVLRHAAQTVLLPTVQFVTAYSLPPLLHWEQEARTVPLQ